ncbi:4Fe-4S dicluster domain-containing protein [Patescibacteria group bacterium]|nr:4Fe-4S dicluster domain-containing protein [Patescibacteria group bacterium]
MNQSQLDKFIIYLQKNDWSVFGPVFATAKIEELSPFLAAHQPSSVKKSGQTLIRKITKSADLDLNGQPPFYSFKHFFVPEKELMFNYNRNKLAAPKIYPEHSQRNALIGMSILDLKAVNLYDQVFEKDPYYQNRRRNTLIIGYSLTPEITDNIFEAKYEEDILEHLPFDIFLAEFNSPPPLLRRGGNNPLTSFSRNQQNAFTPLVKGGAGGLKIFTGSIKGQRILEHFGYKDYEHIQFSGPVKEGKLDEKMARLRDRLKNHHNPKIWEELGKICIECGKCTLICPTCFCFRIDDNPSVEVGAGGRNRCWDSCYYQEFSEVAGPDKPGFGQPKFLSTTAQRLHFWYFHKFARIPDEFDFMGCVGCGRCTKVCPVGIDIAEVLGQIENT